MGPDQPFYGLQAYGLEEGQLPQDRLEEMAAHYIAEIQSVWPDGPYILGGQCFGGSVAFEMAQQLQAQGLTVALLFMFDARPPTLTGASDNAGRYYARSSGCSQAEGNSPEVSKSMAIFS